MVSLLRYMYSLMDHRLAHLTWKSYSVIVKYLIRRCKRDIRLENKKRKREKENSNGEEWEKFINQKQLEVWRRPVNVTGLFEYKGMSELCSLLLSSSSLVIKCNVQ